jgi:signal transduction histidine kinase
MSAATSLRLPDRSLRWRNLSSLNVAIAIAVGAAQVGFTALAAEHQTGHTAMDALAYFLLIASAASLLIRSSHPREALALAVAFTLAYWLLDYPRGPVFIAQLIAFVTVIVKGHRIFGWGTLVFGFVAFGLLGGLTGTEHVTVGSAVASAAWLLAIGAGAELVRTRVERAAEARRTRHEESLRRVGEERLRIARELHDVLAHNVSLINVQAGVALHLLDEHPEQAEPALKAIRQASAETLREMRSVLGTLRRADEKAPRSPAPSLATLDKLVDRMRTAGLEVDITVRGHERPLPQPLDLAAYRVIQEALTNVVRHADAGAARVRLDFGERDLAIEVENEESPSRAGPFAEGNGIVGMRERALGLGGEFAAGPEDGRFAVRARFPLEGES